MGRTLQHSTRRGTFATRAKGDGVSTCFGRNTKRQNPGELVHGHKMEPLSMSESQWPNRHHYRKQGVADAPGPSRRRLKQLHKEKEEKRAQKNLKGKIKQENEEQKHSVMNELSISAVAPLIY
uniref:Uncharacterized protein n=1 Tax=Moniliophthora roreri TaxID=221103 RepID=A0A0W0G5B9_MONRR